MSLPIPIQVNTTLRKVFADGVTDPDQVLAESIKFQELRTYAAEIITGWDGSGNGVAADIAGWQFKFQVGTAFAYFNDPTEVPSVVVASADVDAFDVEGNVLTFSVNFNTDEFLDVITTPDIARFVSAKAELWGLPPGGAWEPLGEWGPTLEGAIFDTTQTPSSSANSYYTAAQIDLMIKVDPATGDLWACKAGAPTTNLTGSTPWGG